MKTEALHVLNFKKYDFEQKLYENNLDLPPLNIETLQVNVTLKCNQACLHCHVDSSPKRTEQMSKETIDKCLEILVKHPQIINLDLTGGAPELNPNFEYFVTEAKKLGKHILVRHNLTVTIDGDPTTKESKFYLQNFMLIIMLKLFHPYLIIRSTLLISSVVKECFKKVLNP